MQTINKRMEFSSVQSEMYTENLFVKQHFFAKHYANSWRYCSSG